MSSPLPAAIAAAPEAVIAPRSIAAAPVAVIDGPAPVAEALAAIAAPVAPALPATEALPSDEAAELLWREVTARVNGKKRMLGAFLEESRFRGMADFGLELEADDLHAAVIDEKDNRVVLHEAIRAVFGTPVAFRCVKPSQPLPSSVIRTNADVQPMIDRTIAFFDGEAVDMTPRPAPGAPPRRGEGFYKKEKPPA
jgi:hypothetical protein